jgi:hypothetical protein
LTQDIISGAATPTYLVPAYDTVAATTTVEKVMTDNWANTHHASFTQFVLNARGLFQSELLPVDGIGRMFYYRDERLSLMVAGQMYGTSRTSDNLTYTDSFNFSITPRS